MLGFRVYGRVDIDKEQHILVLKCCSIYTIQRKLCMFVDICSLNGFDSFVITLCG